MKYTKQAKQEIATHNLIHNQEYIQHCNRYIMSYEKRAPAKNVPNRNMLKALRMMTWENTLEDWARLHVTESYLRFYV